MMKRYLGILCLALVVGGCAMADQRMGMDDGAGPDAPRNIVEIAAGDERFSTLVTAVREAGLADTLSGEGPFTVFAPTNQAFARLPEGTLESLLQPGNRDRLTNRFGSLVRSQRACAPRRQGASRAV